MLHYSAEVLTYPTAQQDIADATLALLHCHIAFALQAGLCHHRCSWEAPPVDDVMMQSVNEVTLRGSNAYLAPSAGKARYTPDCKSNFSQLPANLTSAGIEPRLWGEFLTSSAAYHSVPYGSHSTLLKASQ